MASRARSAGAVVLAVLVATSGCSERPAVDRPAPEGAGSAAPRVAAPSPGPSEPALPAGGLRADVPAPADVPAGLLPLLQASGPRTAEQVAAFSPDPASAARHLADRGFADAYVAQYAAPGDVRSLTVVVVRFTSPDGARADLDADAAEAVGEPLEAAPVGEAADVRRLPLPEPAGAELVTVRTRRGDRTWLVAWRAPAPADAEVALSVARSLAGPG